MSTNRIATPAQRRRLDNMICSGLIGREELQSFISRNRLFNPNDPIMFWENLSPGNGGEIMKRLRPFYDWKPALAPAFEDLEEGAKKAIFWQEIKGVRAFSYTGQVEVWISLRDSFRSSSLYSPGNSLPSSLRSSFHEVLGASLRDELGDSLWFAFRDSFQRCPKSSTWASSWDSSWESFWECLWDSLRGSLFYAMSSALAGRPKEADKFNPLFNLWLDGNFPVGFDKDGSLLVLVA